MGHIFEILEQSKSYHSEIKSHLGFIREDCSCYIFCYKYSLFYRSSSIKRKILIRLIIHKTNNFIKPSDCLAFFSPGYRKRHPTQYVTIG